jgi:transmembrane sensor
MRSLTPEQVQGLAEKKLTGTLTPEEQQLLDEWAGQDAPSELEWVSNDADEAALKGRLFAGIRQSAGLERTAAPVHRIHFLRRQWVAAAVLLLVCSVTALLYFNKEKETLTIAAIAQDVAAPKANKATLSVAGGKQIILDQTSNGSLAALGAEGATKTSAAGIAYDGKASVVEFHTLTNPRGSKPIELDLPDGSKAWLNTASSITYPTAFKGNLREVTMSGEVYFEVKHNAAKPFRVKAGDQLIEDLGTSFNVNAYTDESGIKTTLVEGIVKIANIILKPGEQYFNGKVSESDVDQAVAWKNGLFSFSNTVDLQTALRQLGRWYDVDIVYDGKIPNREFGGKIQRNLSLANVLEILGEQKIHAKIEGNKLIVKE